MKWLNEKKISLKYKIIGSFLILIILSSISIGGYAYYKAKSSIEISVGNTALAIVQSVVNSIDPEQFSKLQTENDMQSEYYRELQTDLSEIRETTGLKYLYTMRMNADGKIVYVVDGTPLDDNDFSSLGDEEEDMTAVWAASFEGTAGYELHYSDEWGDLISAYIPIIDTSGQVIGTLGADFDANNTVDQLKSLYRNIVIIIVAVIMTGVLISWLLSVFLVRSLYKLKQKAELVKEGDLTLKFDNTGNDEIGVLGNSFKEMVNSLLTITNEIKNSSKTISNDIEDLYKSFSETTQSTEEITRVITQIATGAIQQTDKVEDVLKSMNEVFNQVEKSVGYASLVSDASNQAVANTSQAMKIFKSSIDKVVTVNNTIEHTATIIKELEIKSLQISSFSEVISQITTQTNLLSLNAAIEAARAGEHGKGFAVVANEVKGLAKQSNEANKQISEISGSIQKEIEKAIKIIQNGVIQATEGVSAVTKVDVYLIELQKSSDEANMKVKEIIDSLRLIKEVCLQAVNQVHELADISKKFSSGSQQAAASTEEQSAIIQQINENIHNIKQTTNDLNYLVNRFKVT